MVKRTDVCLCWIHGRTRLIIFTTVDVSWSYHVSLEVSRVKELRIVAETGLLKPAGESDQRSDQCTGLSH